MKPTLIVASDHAGFALKQRLKPVLERLGIGFEDIGTHSEESVDYPDYAHRVARAVASGEAAQGLLVCGSGQGMVMAANRHRGVRAALVCDEQSARLSREHNDANVLALGGRLIDHDLAERILKIWLETPFSGGRHQRRVKKIDTEGQ